MSDLPELPEDEDVAAIRALALSYPETHEDYPWGHLAVKVRKKAFVFVHVGEESLNVTLKLPQSHPAAVLLPYAEPAGYGLGKSGWVSASFGPETPVPLDQIRAWLDESYRAVAPKTLVKKLPAVGPPEGTET